MSEENGSGSPVRIVPTPDGAVISGEMCYGTSGVLEERLRALDVPDSTEIVLDVSRVTFCDSSGLSALVGAHRRARQRGARITLRGAQGPMARVLTITGLDAMFDKAAS